MVDQVLAAFEVRPGGTYIDCTVGEGGHAQAILGAAEPGPRLLGIDLDGEALSRAGIRLKAHGERVTLTQGNFADLRPLASDQGHLPADGVLFDLGMSSMQLEDAERGFSFSRTGPLDMRFDATWKTTAYDLTNEQTEQQLADIISRFGEVPKARRIARAIVRARPIQTTTELARVVARATGRSGGQRTHPATRVFQALRIAVNQELDNIREGVEQAIQVLTSGGRLVVISYHSLEDRPVKEFLKREATDCICPPETPSCVCEHQASIKVLTRRVIKPSLEEMRSNPRSRSARMRVAQRI